mmetsp:Transcript_3612/g.8718  ORF Transcript_3612/g.8718 Transcript_3612/m.8718 type:complete len:417 (+) Transcript_3612:65-1315(+)
MTSRCDAVLRTGKRKGEPCGKKALQSGRCGTHLRSPNRTANCSTTTTSSSSFLSPSSSVSSSAASSPSYVPSSSSSSFRQQAASLSLSSLDSHDSPLLAHLLDPITQELLRDPVVTTCGHTFGAESLHEWMVLNRSRVCPLCKRRLSPQHDVFPNLVVRELLLLIGQTQSNSEGVSNATTSTAEVKQLDTPLRRLLWRVLLSQFEHSLSAYGVVTSAQLFSLTAEDFAELGFNPMQQRRLLSAARSDTVTAAESSAGTKSASSSSSRPRSPLFAAARTYAERAAVLSDESLGEDEDDDDDTEEEDEEEEDDDDKEQPVAGVCDTPTPDARGRSRERATSRSLLKRPSSLSRTHPPTTRNVMPSSHAWLTRSSSPRTTRSASLSWRRPSTRPLLVRRPSVLSSQSSVLSLFVVASIV